MALPAWVTVDEFLGVEIYGVAAAPERAESFLVHRVEETLAKPDFPRHKVIASGPALNSEQIQLLSGLVRDGNSYEVGRPHCVPHRNFAVRLWRGDASVDVLIAFNCSRWDFYSLNHWKGSFCFSIHGELLRLVKSLFPEYASVLPRSAWKQGAIKRLIDNSQR